MPRFRRRPRRFRRPRIRAYIPPLKLPRRTLKIILLAVAAAILLNAVISGSNYLSEVSGNMALINAVEITTLMINKVVNEKMSEGDYDYGYFVNLEKDGEGGITAITTNMTRVNLLSSEILHEIVGGETGTGVLNIMVPLGNLTGMDLLLGRGPDVPVRILLLTTSFTNFRNELASAGINQTKHQIILDVTVNIEILVPWGMLATQVVKEVLIAETVIVGRVPDTFLSMGS